MTIRVVQIPKVESTSHQEESGEEVGATMHVVYHYSFGRSSVASSQD